MRTTLTLDDDVAALVNRARETQGRSLKAIVNEALRCGLRELRAPDRSIPPFETRAVDLGACKLGNLDDVVEALAVAEGEGFG